MLWIDAYCLCVSSIDLIYFVAEQLTALTSTMYRTHHLLNTACVVVLFCHSYRADDTCEYVYTITILWINTLHF